MPHAVINGAFDLGGFSRNFQPIHEESDAWIIKADEIYVERLGARAILPVVVIEEGHPQSFYIRLAAAESGDRTTIRLDPSTDPIKTAGVKRSVARVAEEILRTQPGLRLDRHNLTGLIQSNFPA
ncbi:MAG: hypothetical protein GC154_20095 [bacterium]|nr:hypothetical protein [bacterium]